MAEDSRTWARGKATMRETGTEELSGLSPGELVVFKVSTTYSYWWSNIRFNLSTGLRATVIAEEAGAFWVEVYRYTSSETTDYYYTGSPTFVLSWTRTGGSSRDGV